MFDEGLFIDSVDSEWCLRCRSKQIPIHVVPAAVMRHRVGNRSIRLGRFTILQHNPTRCYYQLRNCFHMMRRKHVPFALRAAAHALRLGSAGLFCCSLSETAAPTSMPISPVCETD